MAMGSSAMDLVTLRPEIDFQGPIIIFSDVEN